MQMMLKASQKVTQILTTQLVQHLDILQYSTSELEQYIYEKAIENPLLVVADAKAKGDYEDMMQMASRGSNQSSSSHVTAKHEAFDVFDTKLVQKANAAQYLFEQVPLHANLSAVDLNILRFLIHSLDHRLFLDVPLHTVAATYNTTLSHVEGMLDLLQTFEPIGVGARNLTEYLLLQIDRDLLAPRLAALFIEEELELVAAQNLRQLSKKYAVSLAEVKETIQYIKQLNPVVLGNQFETTSYVTPEIDMKQLDGEWIIQLNRHHLPAVTIDENYVALLKADTAHKDYYQQVMNDALALLQGIEQRDKTLYGFARWFAQLQPEFLKNGIEAIKPMRLKDMAAVLNVHESTVSRAIRGKYMQTPHGIYALQSLFTKGIVNTSGKIDSITYIKKRLKQLIDNEDKQKPLADQQITHILCAEGIQISRRTVAKYREEMKIMSSFNRISC